MGVGGRVDLHIFTLFANVETILKTGVKRGGGNHLRHPPGPTQDSAAAAVNQVLLRRGPSAGLNTPESIGVKRGWWGAGGGCVLCGGPGGSGVC